jgi:AcrR family transcriptional regulator
MSSVADHDAASGGASGALIPLDRWQDLSMPDQPLRVPRVLRLMWGRAEAPRRGPKPAQSLADITATAVRLADAEGLAAASLPRVAAELGIGTSSLYRYFDSRDDLDAAMLDHAYGRPPTASRRRGWQSRLRAWALANFDVLEHHPWILQMPVIEPPLGPNRTAWTEHGLAAFDSTDTPPDARLSALLLVEMCIRGYAQLTTTARQPPTTADGFADRPYSERLSAVLDGVYPQLHAALDSGSFDSGIDDLSRALGTLIIGIEQRLS